MAIASGPDVSLNLDGDLNLFGGGFEGGDATHTITGDWYNNGSGTVDGGMSTVVFDDTNPLITPGGIGTDRAFYNVECSASGTASLGGEMDITVE
jgi:hypothetical protein